MRSYNKYTLVAWRNEGQPAKALVRTPLKELVAQLDTEQFAQVHCAVVVNLSAISHVTRGEKETATLHLKGRVEVLPVSRSYGHLFREMWRRPAHAWVKPLTGLHSEIRLTLKENGLRMRKLFVSLLGICLFCTASAAMAQQGSGSVTIDGKTIALPCARLGNGAHAGDAER